MREKQLYAIIVVLAVALAIVSGYLIALVLRTQHESPFYPETEEQQQAIHTGKHFLDGIGYVTGDVLFAKLDEKNPNFYWHELAKLEKPDVQGLRSCWIVSFEQADRPGHWFEVWIDAETGEVIGGMQCR